jgi:DNA polymerase III delta prime subunit
VCPVCICVGLALCVVCVCVCVCAGVTYPDWSCGEVLRVNIDEGGMRALLKLSRGDMRRALNIIQACASAYDSVTADRVHATTGAPLPSDVEEMVRWLLNEPFATAFHRTFAVAAALAQEKRRRQARALTPALPILRRDAYMDARHMYPDASSMCA